MNRTDTESDWSPAVASDLAIRIFLPPVLAFVLLSAYVVAESLGFRALAQPEGETAAETAALGHAARTVQLIFSGQNPNQLLRVRPGFLDTDTHDLRPLEAAVLGRHAELVRLLVRDGAVRFDTTRAACFARARLPEVLPDLGASPLESTGAP